MKLLSILRRKRNGRGMKNFLNFSWNNLKFKKIKFGLPLTIHIWGGLGSQLCAWAYVLGIQKQTLGRPINLVFHSAGVTERFSELEFLESIFRVQYLHDFRDGKSPLSSATTLAKSSKRVLKIFKYFFSFSGIIAFKKPKIIFPWTLIIRHHFFDIGLSEETLDQLVSQLVENQLVKAPKIDKNKKLLIHYRLGDLLTIDSKPPIQAFRLIDLTIRRAKSWSLDSILLASDSPELSLDRLSPLRSVAPVLSLNIPPWEMIQESINCKHFIGTASKLSLWVALVRFAMLKNTDFTNYLPNELLLPLSKLCNPNLLSKLNISFY